MGIWTKGQTYSCFIQGAQRDPGHGDEPGENVSFNLNQKLGLGNSKSPLYHKGSHKKMAKVGILSQQGAKTLRK